MNDDESKQPIQLSTATVRTVNVFTHPPLSKRYMLNPRGTRDDVPEWSKREAGFTLRSVGSTGE